MITAFVLINTASDLITETSQAIADLAGVSEVYSCAGDVDLIAIVSVSTHEEIADVVTRHISRTPGVVRTATHIAFRSYSRHDTDAAFDLGAAD